MLWIWVLLVLIVVACSPAPTAPTPTPVPTETPEPIVPTRTPAAEVTPEQIDATAASPQATPSAIPAPTNTPVAITLPAAELARFGVAGPLEQVAEAVAAGVPMGAYLNWRTAADPPVPPEVAFWQMLRLWDAEFYPPLDQVAAIIDAQPGAVWLIGNEPDVPWQDGVTAEQYAELYQEAYRFIKGRDPSAVIGAGGVAMPSPLRLAYLDDVLAHYETTFGEPMPVDLWSVHAFTLREELDSWGVGIPPGMDATSGQLFEIEDHADVEIFSQHVRDFRAWLAANGYRETPLAVTEFGILLPADYGFPDEVVADYLRRTMELMRTATDSATGYPADGDRLVQVWFWYSLYDEGAYPTGDLFDPATGTLTALGEAYRAYVLSLMP